MALPFRSHTDDGTCRGADEYNSILGEGLGEFCVLAQESVTRMNGLRIVKSMLFIPWKMETDLSSTAFAHIDDLVHSKLR
jgi:hypothetical protein